METVPEIIDALGGPTAFGRICGFSRNPAARGSDMRQRGSIPVTYWPALIAHAEAKHIKGLTYATLVAAHAAPVAATVLPTPTQAAVTA